MMRPFVFVGCGGSGIRTLKAIHGNIRRSLDRVGYIDGVPSAFQFVGIDVPATNQISVPSDIRYVNLSDALTVWGGDGGVDRFLAGSPSKERRRDYLQWRSTSENLVVDLTIGAGQYRAVGRALSARDLSKVAQAFNNAVTKSIEGAEDLRKIGELLGYTAESSLVRSMPTVVLVSSLCGGAGAGVFLDVAEMIRLESTNDRAQIRQNLISVLFDPSVFDSDENPIVLSGIPGNAYGAICELVAGSWSPRKASPHLTAGKGAVGDFNGPQYTFLVGSKNGNLDQSPDKVYSTTAKTLCSWVLNPGIASHFDEITLGNWQQNALNSPFHSHKVDNISLRMPISAMGYARLDLGRNGLRDFAIENMLRIAVEHLLDKHNSVFEIQSGEKPETIITQNLRSNMDIVYSFLSEAKINENSNTALKQDNNNILDALRDPELERRLDEIATDVLKDHVRYSNLNALASDLENPEVEKQVRQIKESHLDAADKWTERLQSDIGWAVVDALGRYGFRIVEGILEESKRLMSDDFPSQLVAEKDSGEIKEWKDEWEVRNKKPSFNGKKNGVISSSHLAELKTIVTNRLKWMVERDLRDIASGLCREMASGLIDPVLRSIRMQRENLEEERKSDDFELMSRKDVVAPYLMPTVNEILVDEPSEWWRTFERLVQESGTQVGELAIRLLKCEVGRDIDRQTIDRNPLYREIRPFSFSSNWVPQSVTTRSGKTPSASTVKFAMSLQDLKLRANAHFKHAKTGESKLVDYCGESIAAYLTDQDLTEQKRKNRVGDFKSKVKLAIQNSSPMVEMAWQWVDQKYGVTKNQAIKRYMSPIPLPAPDVHNTSREIADLLAELLNHNDTRFEESTRTYVEIFACYVPMPPANFISLVEPIVGARIESQNNKDSDNKEILHGDPFFRARRTRPLDHFLPFAPEVRLTFARGWIIGGLTGAIFPSVVEKPHDFKDEMVTINDYTRPITVRAGAENWKLLHPPVGSFHIKDESFADVAALALALSSGLMAEMYAVGSQGSEPLNAFEEVLRLGFSMTESPSKVFAPSVNPLLTWVKESGTTDEERIRAMLDLADELERRAAKLVGLREEWFDSRPADGNFESYPTEFHVADIYQEAATQIARDLRNRAKPND